MRQHHVGGELERGGAGPCEGEELLEDLLGQPLLPALEGMVEPRGQRRRATVTVERLPRRLDADLLEERHQTVEDLGHAAHLAAHAHVEDPTTTDALGEAPKKVDRPGRHDRAVVLERRPAGAHAPAVRTASQRATSRRRTSSTPKGKGFKRAIAAASSGSPSCSSTQVAKSCRRRPFRPRASTTWR